MGFRAMHVTLVHGDELGAKAFLYFLLDLFICVGLLVLELVAREADDGKAALLEQSLHFVHLKVVLASEGSV